MANTTTIQVLFGENEELYQINVSAEEYEQIIKGDKKILEELINKENEKRSATMIQQITNSNNNNNLNLEGTQIISSESDVDNKDGDEKESFNWPEKAVMLFLELYREREHEFTTGQKRHNKIWAEIASELRNSNYNVSAVQVQNKMSSLKRTYKKVKDSNAKSGNQHSSWTYYSVMDSLFNNKGWVNPPATASSDGPTVPSALHTSTSSLSSTSRSSSPCFELQDISSSKPKIKKRKVEVMLESFISDLKTSKTEMKEERRKEQEVYRKEKIKMHKETTEIQKSLVGLLGKLLEKQNESK